MEDLLNKNIPQPSDPGADRDRAAPLRTGPTGPRTPAGKAISSMNGITHGCCSKIAVLPNEDPAEFEFVRNFFMQRYDATEDNSWLIDEFVLAYWHFKRASQRLFDLEVALPTDPHQWTGEDHKSFSNFSRYKTTEERRMQRFYKQLEDYDDKSIRQGDALRRAHEALHKCNLEWMDRQNEKIAETLKLNQWIDVEVIDGKCVTKYYPSNQEVTEQAALLPSLPVKMTRWISFPHGVPDEYDWTHPLQLQKKLGDTAVQTMSYLLWQRKIKEEEALGTGHVRPVYDIR